MNEQTLPENPDGPQGLVAGLRDDMLSRRLSAIAKYRAAQFWTTRRAARADTLHYGRLVRMLGEQS